jgi:2'-5' RNA ligase
MPTGMQRVFIGIPVDEQSQRQINELLKPIKNPGLNISWVTEKNRHLTLVFLGNTHVTEVKTLLSVFDQTYQQESGFEFKLTKLTRFPGPEGRIIALTGDPDLRLDGLFSITLNRLQQLGIAFDRKAFRAHVTLARIRNAKHFETSFEQPVNINLKVDRITLYRSVLTESGSIYSSLKETQLG